MKVKPGIENIAYMTVEEAYRPVREARRAVGYEGQDCGVCPGSEACVRVYDIRCVRMISKYDVFPCGLRPDAYQSWDGLER